MINLQGNPFYLTKEEISQVESCLSCLSIEEKVGQLFIVLGDEYSDDQLIDLVHKYHIGGVLFRPAPSKEINLRYSVIGEDKVPLLRCANLEEGGVGAISDGTYLGWPMQICAAGGNFAKKAANVAAKEASKVGINVSFSPDADIDMNYLNPITNVRTFGSNTALVKKNTALFATSLLEHGIMPVAKHFPGDGLDYRDQHLHPTINSLSARQWDSTYGVIYSNLINKGIPGILVGHIKAPKLEKSIDSSIKDKDILPAPYSKNLLQGLLRGQLVFNGVIFSDATIMGGFTQAMARKLALPYIVNSGIDMIIFNLDFYEDYSCLLDAVKTNLLSLERLDEAVTRILALKQMITRPYVKTKIDCQKTATQLADNSITLVKNVEGILPISKDRYPFIRLVILGNDQVEDSNISLLAKTLLEKEGFDVSIYKEDEEKGLSGTSKLDKRRLTIYLANEPTESNRVTVRLFWHKQHAKNMPRFIQEEDSIFISLFNPYHLQDVPLIKTYVNAYSPTKVNLKAVIEKLIGKSSFKGISPVDAYCGLEDTHY